MTGVETVRHPDIKTEAGIPFMLGRARERERERVSTTSTSFFTFVISCLSHLSTRRVQSHVHLSMIQNLFMKPHVEPSSCTGAVESILINLISERNHEDNVVGGKFPVIVCPGSEISCCLKLTSQRYRTANTRLSSAQQ